MANPGYSRTTRRLYCSGIDLNNPVDSIRDGYFPILENIRSYTAGEVRPRNGITQVAASVISSKTPVHSVRRLNNKADSTWTRIVGTGNALAYGQTSFTQLTYNSSNITISGNPLAMVPWRPEQSPVSWMYVADSSVMRKVTWNGSVATVHQFGLQPPTTPPVVELDSIVLYTAGTLSGFFTSTSNWTNSATVTSAVSHQNPVNTTSVTGLFDSGTSGWACVVPTSMTNIGAGTWLEIIIGLNTYYVIAYEVYKGSSTTASSVATILYDNAATNQGNCTIVPVNGLTDFKRNAVVLLNGTTYARIFEVVYGPNDTIIGVRCNTGTTTITAGQSLRIVDSFRTILGEAIGAGATIKADSIQSTFTAASPNFTGYITYTPVAAFDFTTFNNSKGISDDDYMHFSFKCEDLSKIVGGRILFDCGDGSFTQNYFLRAFTPSDLLLLVKGTQTAIDNRNTINIRDIISGTHDRAPNGFMGRERKRQNDPFTIYGVGSNLERHIRESENELIDDPSTPIPTGPPRDQTGTGNNQWHELRFRRGECVRVGTAQNLGWKSINAIRFEVTMTSSSTATIMEFGSFHISGGYNPDIGDIGFPYLYRYRYRSSVTGAKSNWSPATRSGIFALRQQILVSGSTATQPEVDLIDFQRWGGTITEWATIGTAPTAGFTDTVGDAQARGTLADSDGDIHYQPWVTVQAPISGTATTVAGTLVLNASTTFNTGWVKGTAIKVNGLQTFIRRVISTSLMEVEDAIATGSNVTWEIPEPYLGSQNLPCFWGPYNGWFFGCGDSKNPGRLYYSNQNDPDSTQDTYWLEVTGPSDPLQNGLVYNGRCYVFSSEKLFEILEIAPGQFVYQETPAGKGLQFRWAFCAGPSIWFLGKDGIYQTEGGEAVSITDETLFPLFPNEGGVGITVNGFLAPNMVTGQDANFRLSYYDNYLYFDYVDTAAAKRTLMYTVAATEQAGWFPDVYTPGITFHYGEEGDGVHSLLLCGADATTGKLYTLEGTTDNGTAISWHLREPSYDAGDRRADKIWGDFILDANPGGGSISIAAATNNYATAVTLNSSTMTGSARTQKVFDISSGNGVEGRNFAVDLSGTGVVQRLYILEPSYSPRPEDTYLRAFIYDDCDYAGEKFFQAVEVETDTDNLARTVRVEYDGGTLGDILAIQHNGQIMKPYSFTSSFIAHMVRMIPTDTNYWKSFKVKWIWEPEPPLVNVWESQQTSHGHVGFIHLRNIWFTHTSTADLTLTITRMDDNTSQTFTIPNSGGVRGRMFYLTLGPAYFCKGKTYQYKITQADNIPFRIYLQNCGVMIKPWGSEQQFARWAGWGAVHGDGKASY